MSASARKNKKRAAGPWLWPVVLIIVGIVLLLDNFLLLGDFNAVALLPLLLVVAGAQILLRGDLLPSAEARTFAITRGSVEAGTLEISSGAIDVEIRALQREGRLIAGQYAADARPALDVEDTYAHLRMARAATPWYAFADWKIAVAKDLPWQLLISTHLGQVDLDLSSLIVHDAVIATGIGDVRVIAPQEALGLLFVRSTMGNIHIVTPPGHRTQITVESSRTFSAQADEYRYESPEPNVYHATEYDEDAPLVQIRVTGTFGDAYLI